MNEAKTPSIPPKIVLLVGIFSVSFSAIFTRWAQAEAAPSLVIAAWRLLLSALLLLPLAWRRHRPELARLGGGDWRLALFSGMMLAIHFASWISSLAYTSVTSSTVLSTSSPLWVGLASPFLLGESLNRPLKLGLVLGLLGSVVISLGDAVGRENGRFLLNSQQLMGGETTLLGNGLALLAAITGAVYLIIGRRLRPRLSLVSYITIVYGMAALCLLLVAWVAGYSLWGYSALAYLLFLLMAIFPQLLGHSSYNWALGYLPAAYVGVTVFAEPIGATILAFFLLQERPSWVVVMGSALVFAGVLVASRSRR